MSVQDKIVGGDLPFWKWLVHSGDNTGYGASARKLTIPPFVIFVGWLHFAHSSVSPTHFLYADLAFILLLVGLLKTEDLFEFILKLKGKYTKNETTNNPNTDTINP